MTIAKLVEMLERRIVHLSQLLTSAQQLGDLDRAATLEADITETEDTLAALRALE